MNKKCLFVKRILCLSQVSFTTGPPSDCRLNARCLPWFLNPTPTPGVGRTLCWMQNVTFILMRSMFQLFSMLKDGRKSCHARWGHVIRIIYPQAVQKLFCCPFIWMPLPLSLCGLYNLYSLISHHLRAYCAHNGSFVRRKIIYLVLVGQLKSPISGYLLWKTGNSTTSLIIIIHI